MLCRAQDERALTGTTTTDNSTGNEKKKKIDDSSGGGRTDARMQSTGTYTHSARPTIRY